MVLIGVDCVWDFSVSKSLPELKESSSESLQGFLPFFFGEPLALDAACFRSKKTSNKSRRHNEIKWYVFKLMSRSKTI